MSHLRVHVTPFTTAYMPVVVDVSVASADEARVKIADIRANGLETERLGGSFVHYMPDAVMYVEFVP